MKIKDKAYLVLLELGGRATEGELVDKYIETYPDYDKNYKETVTTSKGKIRGTINAELDRNSLHKNIKVDKSKKPHEYYIKKHIVIQPIGKSNTIDSFLKNNSTRWAERITYKKQWEQSLNSIVLFIKDGNIFAKGCITRIEKSDHLVYPLNYYYQLTLIDNIDYKKVVEYAEHKARYFQIYKLLDEEKSNRIFKYINSQEQIYLDDAQADEELQKSIRKIEPIVPDENPQKVKPTKEKNGIKVFPRNLGYSKFSLEKANYLCEIDKEHITFISNSSKKQYVEAHHLIPLKEQIEFRWSLDIPANIISLCSNCHRKMHFANLSDKKSMIKNLLDKRRKELQKYGIIITEEELYSIYDI